MPVGGERVPSVQNRVRRRTGQSAPGTEGKPWPKPHQPHTGANFLLRSLPDRELRRYRAAARPVRVEPEQIIYRQGEPIEYVYFPTTAMLSWIGSTQAGERVEVGVVGWEGMLGIPELLGFEISPYGVEVELPGEVLRIKASRFKKEFERLNSIHSLLFRYTYTALTPARAVERLRPLPYRRAAPVPLAAHGARPHRGRRAAISRRRSSPA